MLGFERRLVGKHLGDISSHPCKFGCPLDTAYRDHECGLSKGDFRLGRLLPRILKSFGIEYDPVLGELDPDSNGKCCRFCTHSK